MKFGTNSGHAAIRAGSAYVIRMVAPSLKGGGVHFIWLPACPLHRKISAFFSEIDGILVSQHHYHQNRRNSAKFRKKSVKFSRKSDKSAFFRENLQNDAEFSRKSSKNSEKSEKSGMVQRNSCRSWKTLKNEYLDAKIGVDTAENEPSKVCVDLPACPPPPTHTIMYARKR